MLAFLHLQAAAHVQYSLGRARVLANIIAFLPYNTESPERTQLKATMRDELDNLEDQYFTMLYGGSFASQVRLWQPYVGHNTDECPGRTA